MKIKHYLVVLLLLGVAAQTCTAPYQQVPFGSQNYCIKCDTTCATCSGGTVNTCATCPGDFTFNPSTSSCTPPATALINTLQSNYHIYGFLQSSTWSGGSPIGCGIVTVLAAGSGGTISTSFVLSGHYLLRLKVSVWWLSGSGNVYINMNTTVPTSAQFAVGAPAAMVNTTSTSQAYCTGSLATNVEWNLTNYVDNYMAISFTSASNSWGIREFVFIQYSCLLQYCATCTGPLISNCLSCTDSAKAVFSGICLCDYTRGYYNYPDPNTDQCSNPCPSLVAGQYYGDYTTKKCVAVCPSPLFSSDVTNQCVATCPAEVNLGGIPSPLYYDVRNRKCVTACPSTEPYSYWSDRKCLSVCPAGFYRLDTNLSCVSQCPASGAIPLFADPLSNNCVYQCIGSDYWADFLTKTCTNSCSGGYFQDSSSGRNLCTQICPYPNYFGDATSDPLQPTCATSCPVGTFGDMAPVAANVRRCISLCSGGYYGLLTGNRTCVEVCPSGTWGEHLAYTCINTPNRCTYTGFADNSSRLCIGGTDNPTQVCSNGMYKYNTSRVCVTSCPSGTYASDVTYFCQSACVSPYFADPGINACVAVCYTQDLFADVHSSRTCVDTCNQLGLTPYMDDSTKKCVNICPDTPYYFADPITYHCSFLCTSGLYADSSVVNKTCVANCPNLYFGFNSTVTGECLLVCPDDPPYFGDVVDGERICVPVCQMGKYGDQDPSNNRYCVSTCPSGWFAQNDTLRRCVRVCNKTTYGWNLVCGSQFDCPALYVGDPSTQLCVNWCPPAEGTFADDIVSKLCVVTCQIVGATIYFADPSVRWCVATCSAASLYFGNNNTQTCETNCLDDNAYADPESTNRFCIKWCTYVGVVKYYRNNYTMTCVLSTNCQVSYYADNSTQACVDRCPIVIGAQTWGHPTTKTCVSQCYASLWGDASTGIAYCIPLCPTLPAKWSYDGNMTCMTICPTSPALFGQDFTRTCVANCPRPPSVGQQTYAYTGTRRCLYDCPATTYADYIQGVCFPAPVNCILCAYSSASCAYRWADAYNNSCVYKCAGPAPDDSYGDNVTSSCTLRCSVGSYADSYTGTRICVAVCPGIYNNMGVPTGLYDSFGDNNTQRCLLRCATPSTWADWQTHRCQFRCSGDSLLDIPTYSQNTRGRCTVALSCPEIPDKLYGENISRSCVTTCLYYSNGTISYADNITRTCLYTCQNYTNATNALVTRFFGDVSMGPPRCVIICPISPRMFGDNSTNLCVAQCADHEYGDQTGNRSCVALCPIIGGIMWYSQLTERICVLICESGTFGDTSNQHCQTVATDCISTEYGDDSINMCVALCPVSMNYFGDPSTKLCVSRCPNLLAPVVNATAGINLPAGTLFADYSNRLCVFTCSSTFGLTGTFGDNTTGTCVQVCPPGTYGDPNTLNRFCVSTCTSSAYADTLTMLCVLVCPYSPPTFGYSGNWTCMTVCPVNLFSHPITRRCVSSCAPLFRSQIDDPECVEICPSNPDLYGDSFSGNCTVACSNSYYADPTDRLCKPSCLPLFQYGFRCVSLCPVGYYADALGDCVVVASCDPSTFGSNLTTKCVGICPVGSFADSVSGYCIAVCPDGTYGDAEVCVATCQTPSTTASALLQLCVANCPDYTYALSGTCVVNCTTGYRNDQTGTCASNCNTAVTSLYADPTIHDCVLICPVGYYRAANGFCVLQNGGCNPMFADLITGDCVTKCSSGYWGYVGNYTCLSICPTGLFAYSSATQRTCYAPNTLPAGAAMMFGDSLSGLFVAVCPTTPILYFGDRISQLCVSTCPAHSSTAYYGDANTNQCQSVCTDAAFYTADGATSLCSLKCSLGTFRYNNTPICMNPCPVGYADSSTRTCVATCPIEAQTFGFWNVSTRVCVLVCPVGWYSEPLTRTCTTLCPISYFAYNATLECRLTCLNSYADLSNRICVSQCLSPSYPFADNSTNRCVPTCPTLPDSYGDSNKCVLYCTTPGYYADQSTRLCVSRCPTLTPNTYGDPLTGRCVTACSLGYWGDNSTNLCVGQCPPNSFADNTTGKCVSDCIMTQSLFADAFLHVCAYTCSGGYFGSQVSQSCVAVCDAGYWGDPSTTLCLHVCGVKFYTYGQNSTRTCVNSCLNYPGYADNVTRMCVSVCQNYTTPPTYADPTTKACVPLCPAGYYAFNQTVTCVTNCPAGFADNYTRYCVAVCPSDPRSYGDQHLFICLYSCLNGEYSDNSTNLCVGQCPSVPDYYGDSHNGRCVLFCTEGTYAENITRNCLVTCPAGSFADNLTRRCVSHCPPSQNTYADATVHRCVRVCSVGLWAENLTQTCIPTCPLWANGTQTYADNLTGYCVRSCPYSFFGRNDTHSCVTGCPVALDLYGHLWGRVCVAVTNCFPVDGYIYYADSVSRSCVQKCPLTLWGDPLVFKCRTPCDVGYYRNNHNQMCVAVCPTVPDQYADGSTGNCVRTCPPNSYAYIPTRTCIPDCGPYSLFADPTTNRCVSVCSTNPYLFADHHLWKCVTNCNSLPLFYGDNMTQTCVPQCPPAWSYYADTHTLLCVTHCSIGQYADTLASRTCSSTCSHFYFKSSLTSTCVQHCIEISAYYFEDTTTYSCVAVCPGQSYGYNALQTCMYQNADGSSSCPSGYYADRVSKQCVQFCPNNTFASDVSKYCELTCFGVYYADPVLRRCVTTCSLNTFAYIITAIDQVCLQYCPAPYFAQNETKSCVLNCATLGLSLTRTCESTCPVPYFADNGNHACVLNCTPNYGDSWLRTCVNPCSSPAYSNPLTFTCDLFCPSGHFGRNTTRVCGTTCLPGSFADVTLRVCVSVCADSPLLFADSLSWRCVPVCPPTTFGDIATRVCGPTCGNLSSQLYLADSTLSLCVLECVNTPISFADYPNNLCTAFCPLGTFASNYTKECLPQCPNIPNNTFADNSSHQCLQVCPIGSFGIVSTCVAQCWLPYFADPTTRLCVLFCPHGYYAYNATATCRTNCLVGSYADPTSRRCLAQCPALHDLFNYDGDNTCLAICPIGFYSNTDNYRCVSICNSSIGLYAYAPSNTCVRECPVPYKGYAVNSTCILSCPTLYYFDVTLNVCERCALSCLVCTGAQSCLSCVVGFNLFNGICNISCIPTGGIITYANPAGQCVSVCPPAYFGNNITYACVQSCPIKQYGDSLTSLCSNCASQCAICTNLTYCTSCQGTATMAIDHMCYSNCNSTFQYSYDGQCYLVCPNGTYLTYTNVICVACSATCGTCSGTATNCLSCRNLYYYNSSCLTVCPNGFYGSASLTCLDCSVVPSAICNQPLTYTTSVGVENYQYVITMKFSQHVNISEEISRLLKVNLKLTRLLQQSNQLNELNEDNEDNQLNEYNELNELNELNDAHGQFRVLSVASLINGGVPYTYVLQPDGSIKIYLQITDSLVNPVFSVQITDPSAIKSLISGAILQNANSLIAIASLQYYPPSDSTEAPTNTAATFVIVCILLLYVMTFLWSDTMVRPIQFLQLISLHCIIDCSVPASIYYFLLSLKPSLFQFITNWTGGYFSSVPEYATTPQKIIDAFTDGVFLRNMGQLFTFVVVLGCFWVLFLLLSNRRLVAHKLWHSLFQSFSRRFGMQVVNDVMGVLYLPIVYFVCLQLPFLGGTGIMGFNAFVTIVALLACFSLPLVWVYVYLKKNSQICTHYRFLSVRIKENENENENERKNENENDMNSRNPRHLETVFVYLYLLLQGIWLGALNSYATAQLVLLLLTNLLFIGYIMWSRPYLYALNTVMTVVLVCVGISVEAEYLYFMSMSSMTATSKTAIGYPLLYAISSVLCAVVIWGVWRVIWDGMYWWGEFTKLEFYRQFGDMDVEVEKEVSEDYQKVERHIQIDEPTVGDILVDHIREVVGVSGEKKIKVVKKVLRKKQDKVRGQFVRINPINPFVDAIDRDNQLVRQNEKRHIDDDIRDDVEEISQPQKKMSDPGMKRRALAPIMLSDESQVEQQMEQEKMDEASSEGLVQPQAKTPYYPHLPLKEGEANLISQSGHSQVQSVAHQQLLSEAESYKEVRPLDELMREEEDGQKKKNLLFLFDDFEEE